MESYVLFGSTGSDVDDGMIPNVPSLARTLNNVNDAGLFESFYGTGPVSILNNIETGRVIIPKSSLVPK